MKIYIKTLHDYYISKTFHFVLLHHLHPPCTSSCASSTNSLALGGAEVAGFAPCASFRCGGLTDVALVGRLLQHVLHIDQLSLVILHVLDEHASGVVSAKDLLVDELNGEVFT